MDTAIQFGIRR
jgi:DNA-binding MarR family transcriptional regulator